MIGQNDEEESLENSQGGRRVVLYPCGQRYETRVMDEVPKLIAHHSEYGGGIVKLAS